LKIVHWKRDGQGVIMLVVVVEEQAAGLDDVVYFLK
jgi:hypothetical protein